ncbi:hypothetical protein WKI72_20085 [Candidatus Erwinia dacicola]
MVTLLETSTEIAFNLRCEYVSQRALCQKKQAENTAVWQGRLEQKRLGLPSEEFPEK